MDLVVRLERSSKCQGKELKGGNLIKHPRGRAFLREVTHEMAQFAAPCLFLVEKRFSLCGKIVDTFFDPLFNRATAWAERSDPERMQADAQAFYETDSPLIVEFAEAFQVYDAVRVRQNAESWVGEFLRRKNVPMADKVRATLATIEAQIEKEGQAAKGRHFPSGIDCLNLPIAHLMFQFVEQKCPFRCEIVHDQTATLEPILKYFFDLYRSGPPLRFKMKDGRTTATGFQNVGSLNFASSAKQPLIRAADFALASVRNFVSLALTDQNIPEDTTVAATPHLGGLWCTLYPAEPETHVELGGLLASVQWTKKVFTRFVTEMKVVFGSESSL